MNDGKVLYEEDAIRKVLTQAFRIGVPVEVTLQGDDQRYSARMVSSQDGQPFAEDGLLVTPLEPTAGNIKIRRALGVQLSFHVGEYFFEGKSGFVQLHALENGQALVVMLPRVLRGAYRRQQPRTEVPPEVELTVRIEKRGEMVAQGRLNDITASGLSFSCEALAEPLQRGERVMATIGGRDLGNNTITMPANIAFHVRARRADDIQMVADKYGAQFGTVNAVQSMQIERIIKFLEKKAAKSA